jgi:ATP-dependent Clp protease protease subunit
MNKKPMRIIEGSARPFEAFWRVVDAAQSESGEPEIEFYGPISEYSWMGDEVTPAKFKKDLHELGKGGAVTVRIHSPGGDADAASAIRAMLMDYPGHVTTRIDGLCASAATIVAMAGNKVVMQDSASFMIHNPWTVAIGSKEDLKRAIGMLKTCEQSFVETYQSLSGLRR